jgi:hypothetical protein
MTMLSVEARMFFRSSFADHGPDDFADRGCRNLLAHPIKRNPVREAMGLHCKSKAKQGIE